MKTTDFKVGEKVIYRPYPKANAEEGIVTSINKQYVFVRYRGDFTSKATNPKDLTRFSN